MKKLLDFMIREYGLSVYKDGEWYSIGLVNYKNDNDDYSDNYYIARKANDIFFVFQKQSTKQEFEDFINQYDIIPF